MLLEKRAYWMDCKQLSKLQKAVSDKTAGRAVRAPFAVHAF